MAVLGCIADDFTGASDAASFLVKGGMSVLLYNGVPEEEEGDCSAQAIVIALKSRTQETAGAVRDSLAAAEFLLKKGVKQIYFKYCSTFDSTPEGNIGPVADALMDRMKAPYTVLCPALPVNGRTVEHGKLMVNGIPLDESPMKDHPLTPMWDCRIRALMEPQSRYSCYELGQEELDRFLKESHDGEPFYLIPDYKKTEDGERIVRAFGDLPLLTGGSGLLEPLARRWTRQIGVAPAAYETGTDGPALLLAGSCSQATLGQIAWYRSQGMPCLKLDPEAMLKGTQTLEEAWKFIQDESEGKDSAGVQFGYPGAGPGISEAGQRKSGVSAGRSSRQSGREGGERGSDPDYLRRRGNFRSGDQRAGFFLLLDRGKCGSRCAGDDPGPGSEDPPGAEKRQFRSGGFLWPGVGYDRKGGWRRWKIVWRKNCGTACGSATVYLSGERPAVPPPT